MPLLPGVPSAAGVEPLSVPPELMITSAEVEPGNAAPMATAKSNGEALSALKADRMDFADNEVDRGGFETWLVDRPRLGGRHLLDK